MRATKNPASSTRSAAATGLPLAASITSSRPVHGTKARTTSPPPCRCMPRKANGSPCRAQRIAAICAASSAAGAWILTLRLLRRRRQAGNCAFQQRQIARDNIPDEPQIDAPVAVHQTIAKRDNLRPRNPRASPYLWRKPARRLPDDLEIANDRILHQPLAQQHVATAGNIGFNRLDAVHRARPSRTDGYWKRRGARRSPRSNRVADAIRRAASQHDLDEERARRGEAGGEMAVELVHVGGARAGHAEAPGQPDPVDVGAVEIEHVERLAARVAGPDIGQLALQDPVGAVGE